MNVADYQNKSYSWPPCWQLVADIYRTELQAGVDDFKTVNGSIRAIADAFRIALHKGEHGFRQASTPEDYAVVLMGKVASRSPTHCGLYYQGKVLHATQSGVIYQDLSSLTDQYQRVEYWVKA